MPETFFRDLCSHARAFAGLSDAHVERLHAIRVAVIPHLDAVTDRFYAHLQTISRTAPYLEGRLPALRRTHRAWLEELFTTEYDSGYAERMYQVGDAHVGARLPIEFMAGSMTLIANELAPIVLTLSAGDAVRQCEVLRAVNSALGFSLVIMQESYQISRLFDEREHFLAVSGLTHQEFNQRMAERRGRSQR